MTEAVLSLVVTAILLMGSPGPATLSLAATGATVGFRRGCPFLFGILLGLAFVISAAASGLATLLTAFEQLELGFRVIASLYILYLAYKIATAPLLATEEELVRSVPGFRDGLILNLINVKAYAVFLAIYSGFLLPFDTTVVAYFITGLVCFSIGIFVDVIWLWIGDAIRHLFEDPRAARKLRVSFAVVMVVSVGIVLLT